MENEENKKPSFAAPNLAKKKQQYASRIFVALCVLSVGFLGGWLGARAQINNMGVSDSTSNTVLGERYISSESDLIAAIADGVSPSVVSINVESEETGFFGDYVSQSAGSGIIVSSDGYIVTNKHVIPEGATNVSVTLSDGTTYDDVTIVGRDPRRGMDVAFLKINDVKDLKAAKLADSSQVVVGERVVAIGNALGQFQNTVTSGIISGLSRPITAGDGQDYEELSNLFQTDTAINPGNSGGPLVNLSGEVIAMNVAVADAENIGFAIPMNDISGLIKTVLSKGKLEVPYIGVRYIAITDDIAEELELPVKRGAYIRRSGSQDAIISDSPADKAGLEDKDIITKINDVTIDENNSLVAIVGRYQVGDTITLTVLRGDEELNVNLSLEAAP